MNRTAKTIIGLIAVAVYFILAGLPTPEGLTEPGQKILALMIATIIVWVFEVIPIGVASVFSLMMMPLLGILPMGKAMSLFGMPAIFFIFASFCFAHGFISTGLGLRVSLYMSTMFGSSPSRVLLSFMVATACVSTVMADIPTAIVFGSIAFTILDKSGCRPGQSSFGKSMMLGVPIAAAIGGVATPAGSGLNVMAIDLLKSTSNVEVNFLQWSVLGIPFAACLTLIAWFVLSRMVPSEIDRLPALENIREQRVQLGPMSTPEKKFCIIFLITFVLWFSSAWTGIHIAVISVIMATILFLPYVDVLDWKGTKTNIAWEILLVLGASNALAVAMTENGAAAWIVSWIDLTGAGTLLMLFIVIAFGIFSHLILPVAQATLVVCIPVIALVAADYGINPALLVVPLGYTASCIFLIPVDPIALTTFNYGYWRISEMIKPGFVIAVIWVFLLTGFMYVADMLGVF